LDSSNRFHTFQSWWLVRTEHLVLMFTSIALAIINLGSMNWPRFVAIFVLIDAIGYLPGAIAQRRAGIEPIAAPYHHLYNIAHSYLTAAVVVGVWSAASGSFEWAMLAFPIHLSGDRGVFGNTYKPIQLPFEPIPVDPTSLLKIQAHDYSEETRPLSSRVWGEES